MRLIRMLMVGLVILSIWQGGFALYGESSASSKHGKTYYAPKIDNVRLDWCFMPSQHCGFRTAHAFCKTMGYRHADSYSVAHNIGFTKNLSSGQICKDPQCSGYHWIRCN